MTNLNWRDASKELPTQHHVNESLLLNIKNKYVAHGYYYNEDDESGFYVFSEYGMREYYQTGEVIGWLPISEILVQQPKE